MCLVFYFSLRPAVDPDYGWHIANGRHVLDGATLMGRDIYSWTATNIWVAHEWLTELAMSLIDRVAGPTGNSVVAALFSVLVYTVVVFTLLRRVEIRVVALAVPVCFVGAMQSLAVRPLVLELLYLALLILVIDLGLGNALKRAWFFTCVGVGAVIWANTHGSFLLLPAVLVITAVELLAASDSRWKEFVAAAFVAVIAFAANPWTVHLYAFALQSFTSSTTLARIQEWQQPDLLSGSGLPILLQISVAAIGIFAVSAKTASSAIPAPGRTQYVGLLRTVAFGVLALRSGRHIMLFGIAAAWTIAVGIAFIIDRVSRNTVTGRRDSTAAASDAAIGRGAINVVAAFAVAVSVAIAGWSVVSPRAQERALALRYPVGILAELKRTMTPRERLLNEYRWGGFLIERSVLPVFIDGRSELYGDEQLERYASIVHLDPGWNRLIDSLGITVVLMPKDIPLSRALHDAGWVTLAADSVGLLQHR